MYSNVISMGENTMRQIGNGWLLYLHPPKAIRCDSG